MDNVNHPQHYTAQGSVECIDFINLIISGYRGVVAFDLANATKYVWRFRFKNGLEDLNKAIWYASHACEMIHKVPNNWYTKNELIDICDDEMFEQVLEQFKSEFGNSIEYGYIENIFTFIARGALVRDADARFRFMDLLIGLRDVVVADETGEVDPQECGNPVILLKKLVQSTDDEYDDCEMCVAPSELASFAQVKTKDGKTIFVNMSYVSSFEVAQEHDVKIVTK